MHFSVIHRLSLKMRRVEERAPRASTLLCLFLARDSLQRNPPSNFGLSSDDSDVSIGYRFLVARNAT